MSTPTDHAGVTRWNWLPQFLAGLIFSALGALGANAVNTGQRVTALETRVDDYRDQLRRIEAKLDRALELRK